MARNVRSEKSPRQGKPAAPRRPGRAAAPRPKTADAKPFRAEKPSRPGAPGRPSPRPKTADSKPFRADKPARPGAPDRPSSRPKASSSKPFRAGRPSRPGAPDRSAPRPEGGGDAPRPPRPAHAPRPLRPGRPPRPAVKAARAAAADRGPAANVVHVRWTKTRSLQLPGIAEAKEFFRQETLEHAVEKLLAGRDPLLQPALRKLLGTAPLFSLTFDLAWEEAHRFCYLVTASNRNRDKGTAVLMLARNHQEYGVALRAECENARALYEADPKHVAPFLGAGFVYLPDRYKRAEMGRELPAWLAAWPADAAPMAVGNAVQLAAGGAGGVRLLTRRDTDKIRAGIVTLLFRVWRAQTGRSLNLSALRPQDFLVAREGDSGLRPVLLGTRARLMALPAEKFVRRVLAAVWDTPSGPFSLAPPDPALFLEAVTAACGEEGRALVAGALAPPAGGGAARQVRNTALPRDYVENLRQLMLK